MPLRVTIKIQVNEMLLRWEIRSMSITLPLKEMSAKEKIQAMETLWKDLCTTAGSTLSPNWHQDVLSAREAAFHAGETEIMDWEAAKHKISEDTQ
jgi:hypothetical protein